MYEVYLAHHGILGMKWGVRRYQNPDGSLTAAGRKRYAIDSDGNIRKLTSKEKKAASTAQKQRAAALEKARKARAEKAEYNKQKAEAIKSGEATKIQKYFNDLSPSEMKEAMDRINTKQTFQQMLNKEAQIVANGKTTTDRLMDSVGKATDYAETGIRAYKVIAKINNAFSDNYLPPIGSGESRSEHSKRLEKERREEAKQRKEEARKEKEEKQQRKEAKEEKERQKWLQNATLEEIYENQNKVKLGEWESLNKRSKAQRELYDYGHDRKGWEKKEAEQRKAEAKARQEEVAAAREKAKEIRAHKLSEALFHEEAIRKAAEKKARKELKKSFSSAVSSDYYDYGSSIYGYGI